MLFKDMINEELSRQRMNVNQLSTTTGIKTFKLNAYLQGAEPKGNDLEKICEALKINQDEVVFDSLNISIAEASEIMGKSPNFVRNMVKKGIFGYCDGKNFHIPRLKFEAYMGMRNEWQADEIAKAMMMFMVEEIKKANSSRSKADKLS